MLYFIEKSFDCKLFGLSHPIKKMGTKKQKRKNSKKAVARPPMPPKSSTNKEIKKKPIGNRKNSESCNLVRDNIRISVKVNCSEVFRSYNNLMWSIREHHSKVVVVTCTTPKQKQAEIYQYAERAKIPVIKYPRPYIECSNACGKVFRLPIVALTTPQDANNIRRLGNKLTSGIALFLDGRDLKI
ncbi:uncharacterized protein LOC117892481 [Drosophila subobscura]|uniref:uncharacterized protein LOC117892481 n=1 Tax=Drosophila subobscura TaxID=7241 RepID=UPI00155AFD56|nr:uncharacterized protein LOC117892481 [Drosophila subobscura]